MRHRLSLFKIWESHFLLVVRSLPILTIVIILQECSPTQYRIIQIEANVWRLDQKELFVVIRGQHAVVGLKLAPSNFSRHLEGC